LRIYAAFEYPFPLRELKTSMKTLVPTIFLLLVIAPIFSMADSTTYKDPFEFCKAVKNVDNSESMDDKRYVGPETPSVILKAMGGPAAWRCMDGNVYGCFLGASGRACLRWKNVTTSPTQSIRQFCANNPNSWVVPNSVNDTPWSWVCRGTVGVIDTSVKKESLDKRGYFVGAWKKISD
jgi:hypothetical protein